MPKLLNRQLKSIEKSFFAPESNMREGRRVNEITIT